MHSLSSGYRLVGSNNIAEPMAKILRVDIAHDLELFIDQVSWAAQQLEPATITDVVQLICAQLQESDKPESTGALASFLLKLLRLDAPEQKKAEKALIRLMKRPIMSAQVVRRYSEIAERAVDWSETYAQSLTGQPTRFVSRVTERKPDKELMGALRFQACQWRDILRLSDEARHKQRAELLHEAQEKLQPLTTGSLVPLNNVRLKRLRRHGPMAAEAVEALSQVYGLKHRPSDTLANTLRRGILDTNQTWWKKHSKRSSTALPAMLEFSILTAIAQTAARSEMWKLTNMHARECFRAELMHTELPLKLTINKSAPSADSFTELREVIGLTKNRNAQDSQPDICLTFQHKETKEQISVLGDAKRNGDLEDQGAGYFRDGLRTATYYLAAFGEAVGAKYVDNIPRGAISPAFTLFFRQGTDKVQVNIDTLMDSEKETPSIMACDIEQHFGLSGTLRTEKADGKWSSPFLQAWLALLTQQAATVLGAET